MLPAVTDSDCCVTFSPAVAALSAWVRLIYFSPRSSAYRRTAKSADDVQEILYHLVGGRDDFRIGRVGLLGHDELAELVGDIDIRGFERAADDLAGRVQQGGTGVCRRLVGAAVELIEVVLAVEVRERDLGERYRAAVRIGADDPPLLVDRDRLQLACRGAVLRQQVHLDGAAGIGELGEAARAEGDLDVAERLAVDADVVEREAADRRRELAARVEGEIGSDVDPGSLRISGVRVRLVEQVPGVGMARAERGIVRFSPAELDVHGRTCPAVGRDRTARDRLVEERALVDAEHGAVRGQRQRVGDAEGRRRKGAADLDRVGRVGGGDRDVAARVDACAGRAHAGERLQLGIELGFRLHVACRRAERDRLHRVRADRDGERLVGRNGMLGEQVDGREGLVGRTEADVAEVAGGVGNRELVGVVGRLDLQLAALQRDVEIGAAEVGDQVLDGRAGVHRVGQRPTAVGDRDDVAVGDPDPFEVGVGRKGADRAGAGRRGIGLQTGAGARDRRRLRRAGERFGGEVRWIEQVRAAYARLGGRRLRHARQVGVVLDLRGFLRRDQVVGELQRLRNAPRRVAGRRIDRDAHQVVAGAVDQVAVLVELEVAAAGVEIDAAEYRLIVREGGRLFDDEIAAAVDRHEGGGGRVLDVALDVVGRDRAAEHAARDLLARQAARDQLLEVGLDALVGGGLRVRDVAGDVLQRIRLRAQTGDRGRQCVKNTHNSSPLGSERPSGGSTRTGRITLGWSFASRVPQIILLYFNYLR